MKALHPAQSASPGQKRDRAAPGAPNLAMVFGGSFLFWALLIWLVL